MKLPQGRGVQPGLQQFEEGAGGRARECGSQGRPLVARGLRCQGRAARVNQGALGRGDGEEDKLLVPLLLDRQPGTLGQALGQALKLQILAIESGAVGGDPGNEEGEVSDGLGVLVQLTELGDVVLGKKLSLKDTVVRLTLVQMSKYATCEHCTESRL